MDPDEEPMRVIAAGFPGPREAEEAQRELRDRLDLGEKDLALGQAGGDTGADHPYLLAGRFRAGRLPEVVGLLGDHAGDVLADVPEDWTEHA